jgi:hypothetical protein
MIRTQISLEPEDVSWLRHQARSRGVSLAGVIRELIRSAAAKVNPAIKPKSATPAQRKKIAVRFAFVGCIKDGPESDAKLAEDYLYAEGEVR